MMNVDKEINNFRNFLSNAWEAFELFNSKIVDDTDKEEQINDWLQANWEVLVERAVTGVSQFLEPYGFGADCSEDSSRVCFPEKLPTHRIICGPKNSDKVRDMLTNSLMNINGAAFIGLVSWQDNYYKIGLPLDYVLLSGDKGDIVVACSEVTFRLSSIT